VLRAVAVRRHRLRVSARHWWQPSVELHLPWPLHLLPGGHRNTVLRGHGWPEKREPLLPSATTPKLTHHLPGRLPADWPTTGSSTTGPSSPGVEHPSPVSGSAESAAARRPPALIQCYLAQGAARRTRRAPGPDNQPRDEPARPRRG